MNAPAWVPWVVAALTLADLGLLLLAWKAGSQAADAQEGDPR